MFLSKRNHIYYLCYEDDDGRKRKISTKARYKSDALKFLRTFDERREEIRRLRIYLSGFIEDAVRYAETTLTPATAKLYRHSLRNFKEVFGDVLISRLTPRHFDLYKSARLQKVSPVSVNVELRTIRSALNLALRWQLIERNPFLGLPLARVPVETPPYFSKTDFQHLLESITETWFRDVVIFTVVTGLRRAEVINLKWLDVDLERKVISIHSQEGFRTKGGKSRFVPLNRLALHIMIKRRSESVTDYVFEVEGRRLSGYWLSHKLKKYIRRLGLQENLNYHALRHTFASWLVQDGVSIYEVQKLLGHSDVSTTQIYSHLQPETLHRTVERLDFVMPNNLLPETIDIPNVASTNS
jgi:site-specific recombinase XerD